MKTNNLFKINVQDQLMSLFHIKVEILGKYVKKKFKYYKMLQVQLMSFNYKM